MKTIKPNGRPTKTATEKRTYRLNLKMSTEDYYTLKSRAQEVKETLSEYARQVLAKGYIQQRITPELLDLIRKLSGMANNLNQIAMKAHALNAIDAKHYDDGVRLFEDAVQKILSAVLDPVPMER